MNHKHFEEWLFTYLESDELETEQSTQLQEHLRNCESCQNIAKSWREVDRHLFNAPLASPRTGFTQRWQARLEQDRQLVHRRQTLAALIFTFGGALILLGSLVLLLWPWLRMPEVFIWGWVYRLSALLVYLEPANDLFSIFSKSFSGNVSPLFWILFAGLMSELAVLWLVSYRWLTKPRRVIIDEATE